MILVVKLPLKGKSLMNKFEKSSSSKSIGRDLKGPQIKGAVRAPESKKGGGK